LIHQALEQFSSVDPAVLSVGLCQAMTLSLGRTTQ
jgi:hypothetical protein